MLDTSGRSSTGTFGSVHSRGTVEVLRIVTGSVTGIHPNRSTAVKRSCNHLSRTGVTITFDPPGKRPKDNMYASTPVLVSSTTTPPTFHMVLGPLIRGKSPLLSPGPDHYAVATALVTATASHIISGGPSVVLIMDPT